MPHHTWTALVGYWTGTVGIQHIHTAFRFRNLMREITFHTVLQFTKMLQQHQFTEKTAVTAAKTCCNSLAALSNHTRREQARYTINLILTWLLLPKQTL